LLQTKSAPNGADGRRCACGKEYRRQDLEREIHTRLVGRKVWCWNFVAGRTEIVGWHLCNGQASSVTTKDANKGPNYMLLDKEVCDFGVATIVLRKAKLLGFMTSMYLLKMKTIWPYFGGKKVTFTWALDTGVGGGSAADASRDPHYYDDGTLLKGEQSDPVYVVYGDAKFWIPSPAVFQAMGFDWAKVWVRPEERMALVATVPRDGTLLKEMSSAGVYVVYGGAKFGIPSSQVFDDLGFDWTKVGLVPDGALAQISTMPRDGTLLREMGSDTGYRFFSMSTNPAATASKSPTRLILAPDRKPIVWTEEERKKGQAWGLKTIESFHTHGTPPVGE
jgi:hypothetical protein